jgi:D-arabinan exo alpha-(1,3)/(1,5)-arabinofuranosidase (non-reducing end)
MSSSRWLTSRRPRSRRPGSRRPGSRGLGRVLAALVLLAGAALVGPALVGGAPAAAHRNAAEPSNGPVGWDTYRHPERLAELADGSRTRQFSSFDRTGGNDDGFGGTYSCLRTTDSGCVIAEHTGPGEIDSIWFTRDNGDVTATGDITITLDGTDVLHAPLQDVVDGKVGAPFVYPLVADADQSSGGVYIKVPMPFVKSMVVTTDENPVFYHVTYRQFASADGVGTFDPTDPATDVLDTLKAAGTADPKPAQPGATTTTAGVDVAPGATATLATETGPGAVTALSVHLPQLTTGDPDAVLAGARLRISFDGTRTVDAPLGEFFGTGLGLYPVRALYFAVDPDTATLTCWWLMPYRSNASIALYNGSDTAISGGDASVTAAPSQHWASDLASGGPDGYFRATANRSSTVDGQDYAFLDAAGRGRLLGVSHTMIGGITSGNERDYLEGDERLYVDGTASPDMHGTGTEDFYESGWYFNRGTYTNPFNGNPAHETGTADCANDCTSAYRLMLAEGPDFSSSIRFGIEHGPGDHDPATYASTAYWYGQSTNSLRWTDSLTVGDGGSEAAHGYTGGGAVSELTATYEGNDGTQTPLTATTRATSAAVSFTMAVDKSNDGVVLRRTSDQDQPYQAAAVTVDGADAGTWTEPLGNTTHRWLDDSYQLPAALTAGHGSITVTLTPTDGSAPWSAAAYQALSVVPAFADHAKPAAVSGIQATAGSGSIALAWTPARDDVYQPRYQVYGSTTDGFTPGTANLLGTTELAAFAHTGLGISQHWYYRVRAVDAAGHAGPYSAQVSATTGDSMTIEAESLLPAVSATAPVSAQSDCCGVHWSGSAQLFFQPTAAGNTVRVSFTVPQGGDFALTAVQTEAPDYGITTLAVDGTVVGEPFDGYHADSVAISDPIDLGTRHLDAGTHTLDFTVTGKDAGAANYYAGLDYLSLKLVG